MKKLTQEYAYGKINLALDIEGKREDGYHLLKMVMQSVSLHDTLEGTYTRDGKVTLKIEGSELAADENNLCVKAARMFLRSINDKQNGFTMRLVKKIPSQAGMGGGSSDAAAVLRLMNRLRGFPFSEEELCRMGLPLGADVPFCVRGGTQRAEGIGEILTPLPAMPDCMLLLCKPPIGISTPQAFRQADACTAPAIPFVPAVEAALYQKSVNDLGKAIGNRFDDVLQLAQIREIRQAMLREGAVGACMTGSGSVVFGIFSRDQDAFSARRALRPYGQCYLCRPVSPFPDFSISPV